MPDDEALRRARRQKMELRRLAEPGIERGDEEIRRGDEEIRRGDEEIRRGDEEIRRGERFCIPGGIGWQRISFRGLPTSGDTFIVAFVAPVGSPSRSRCRPVRGPSSLQALAAAADAELAELRLVLAQRRMQFAHALQTRTITAVGAAISTGQKPPRSATAKE